MEKLRLGLLAGILGSVLLVLVRAVLTPITAQTAITAFVFPPVVPLPHWQPVTSRPLAASESSELTGRQYRYQQQQLPLEIEMRYLVDILPNVKDFIPKYSSLPPSRTQLALNLRQHSQVGFYYLFANGKRAYLSSCINARGGTTVTPSQFQHNRLLYDLQPDRLLPWLLDRVPALDMRCIWTQLSVPVKTSPEAAYHTLEQVWHDWYQWWQPRFPQA